MGHSLPFRVELALHGVPAHAWHTAMTE
uniref:Uncharacterized protein n=1 Tax=Arundo donax TaxID=35708 RepID=A0A0A9A6F0_ARUDO